MSLDKIEIFSEMYTLFVCFILYSEFKEDRDLIEIPMPSYNFTQAELCCVIETAEELGLEHKVRGSVSIIYHIQPDKCMHSYKCT